MRIGPPVTLFSTIPSQFHAPVLPVFGSLLFCKRDKNCNAPRCTFFSDAGAGLFFSAAFRPVKADGQSNARKSKARPPTHSTYICHEDSSCYVTQQPHRERLPHTLSGTYWRHDELRVAVETMQASSTNATRSAASTWIACGYATIEPASDVRVQSKT